MSGIAVGSKRGFVVTKKKLPVKPSRRRGKLGAHVALVREIVHEVSGYAPYEKRVMELLKVGKEKRALKMCKKRLGTLVRAKKKRDELSEALRRVRK